MLQDEHVQIKDMGNEVSDFMSQAPMLHTFTPESISTESDVDSISISSNRPLIPSPRPRPARRTPEQEKVFFQNIYNAVDCGFTKWKLPVGPKFIQELEFGITMQFLELPEISEEMVIMGRRPKGDRFWLGWLTLGLKTEVVKLRRFGQTIAGVQIGGIEGFGTDEGVGLYMGYDRNLYYCPLDGWFNEDDYGHQTFIVYGIRDIRQFGSKHILDPNNPANISEPGIEYRGY